MIFRLIASIFHLFATFVRREAAIDNSKEDMAKATRRIHSQKADLRELNQRLTRFEIQSESDANRIATLEKVLQAIGSTLVKFTNFRIKMRARTTKGWVS